MTSVGSGLAYYDRYHPLTTVVPHATIHNISTRQDPKTPSEEIKAHYDAIAKEIEEGFAALTDA